jgi:superfamily II DNA or RNA helicase
MTCRLPVEHAIEQKEVVSVNNLPKLRSFQLDLQLKLKDIIGQSSGGPLLAKSCLANIACGGGKSALPLIAFQQLEQANVVDRVAVICPRESLAQQCAEGFEEPLFRGMLKHNYSINEATNCVDPCRGLSGYATTYQAIGADRSQINLHEFKRHRYLLCLDEVHHVAEDSNWHKQLTPLYEAAAFILLMTGTLERGDKQKIAFIPHKEVVDE